jgi:hypothetical protein
MPLQATPPLLVPPLLVPPLLVPPELVPPSPFVGPDPVDELPQFAMSGSAVTATRRVWRPAARRRRLAC